MHIIQDSIGYAGLRTTIWAWRSDVELMSSDTSSEENTRRKRPGPWNYLVGTTRILSHTMVADQYNIIRIRI